MIVTLNEFIKQIKAECVGCYKYMKIGFWCINIDDEWCITDHDDPNGHWQERWV